MKSDISKRLKGKQIRAKWIVLYVVCMLLFVAWMGMSNSILAGLLPQKIEHVDSSVIKGDTSNVYVPVPEVEQQNSMLDEIFITGWAFYKTEQMHDLNEDREIQLILKSETDVYTIKTQLVEREDVIIAHPGVLSEKDTAYLGYSAMFSGINMKDGIYNLYVQCKEDDTNYGLWVSPNQYSKSKDVFQKYEFVSTQTSAFSEKGDLKIITPGCSVIQDGSNIELSGWAVVENRDSTDQSVLIQLKSGNKTYTYTTQQKERVDVANAFNNSLYTNSGYYAVIPVEELDAGSYSVEIVVKYEDDAGVLTVTAVTVSEDGTITAA